MSAPSTRRAWERITAQVHPGCETCGVRTVYWRRYTDEPTPAVGWLAVSRRKPPAVGADDVGDGWRWKYRVAPRPHTGGELIATGVEATVGEARRAALKAAIARADRRS